MCAILIAGPTASGKSALALAVAEETGGVVINADAMQVYRDLRIITARPTPEEEARAPHWLYGHVDATVNYSAGRYLRDAAAALAEARRLGRAPIFVGGTGLYFKALTQGLSAVSAMPCGQSLRPKAPRGCMRNWRNAIRKARHAFLRAIASASPARSKFWRRPAVRSPTGNATACTRCLRASGW